MMQTYEIIVKERAVYPNSSDTTLVRTSIGIDQIHVLFDSSEWLSFPVRVTFGNGDTLVTQTLTLSSVTSTVWAAQATCTIPWEVIEDLGNITLTFHGTASSGNHIITAYGAPLSVIEAGSVGDGTVPEAAPTVDEYTQAYNNAVIATNDAASAAAQIAEILGSTDAQTLEELLEELGDCMRYQDELDSADDLPESPNAGDVYIVDGATMVYDEDSAAWVTLADASVIVAGYYSDGAFYSDSDLTTAITGVEGRLYVDLTAEMPYRYDGSSYVALTVDLSAYVTSAALTTTLADYATTDAVTTALAAKADLASPALTGTPTAPTAETGTNTEQIATTAFVKQEIDANAYTHPDSGVTAGTYGDTSDQTPAFGGTFNAISETVDAQGHVTEAAQHTVTIPATEATTSAAGLMSASDKSKLDGVEASANNYSLPTMDESTKGGATLGAGLSITNGVLANTAYLTTETVGGDKVLTLVYELVEE